MNGGWTLQPVDGDPFAQKQSAVPKWNLQPVEGDPFAAAAPTVRDARGRDIAPLPSQFDKLDAGTQAAIGGGTAASDQAANILGAGSDVLPPAPPDLTGKYNTSLSSSDEAKFQDWMKATGKQNDLFDYDLRGAWKADAQAADNGHLPDTWKKPNHPTFSDESIYNSGQNVGGHWGQDKTGAWTFLPGPTNMATHGIGGLTSYFAQQEPDAKLLPPGLTPAEQSALNTTTEYGLPATTAGIVRQALPSAASASTNGPPLEAGESTLQGTASAVTPPPKTIPEILDHVAAIAPGAIGRIASVVAQATREGYQGGELLDPQSQKALSDAAARGGIIGYLAALVSTAAHDLSYSTAQIPALVHGAQAGLQQFGEETGNQQFARDIAALPEAFPLLGAELGLHGYVPAAAQEAAEPSNIYEAVQQRANESPEVAAGRAERESREANNAEMEREMAERDAAGQSPQARITGPTQELAQTELERATPTPEVLPAWNLEPVEGDPFGAPVAPTPVDEAAAQAVEPTPAQAEAGNYQKGHVTIGGLPIAIETPKGGIRSGVGPDGTPWEVTMPAHYGYVNRTIAADNDHLDVSLGPLAHEAPSHPVFVVDQIDPQTGMFDEHKGFLGFPTAQAAVAAYDGSFSDGSGPTRRGAVTQMPFDQFKVWATKGDLSKPLAALKPQTGATPYIPEPKEPMRLVKFLQQPVVSFPGTPHETRIPGGLIDTGGDVSAIVGGPRGRPGLLNSNGQQLDAATQRAWQAGYLPGDQRPEINDLLAAIHEDHEGRPIYSAHDQDAAQAYQYAQAHNSEIDRLANEHGLPTRGLTREQFFDQLANRVSLADAARLHDEAMVGHQDAFDHAAASARANGIDPEAYTPRSLQEMENEHRQADAATAEGPVSGDDGGRPVVGRDAGSGEVSAGQGGRGVVDAGRAGPQAGGQSALEAAREELPGEGLFAGRRLPAPPQAGEDLFGATRAQPAARTPEPTIRTDQRQADMFGTKDAAVQAQAARDAQGPRGNQERANEGLFARSETPQPELPAAPRASRWPNSENFQDRLAEIQRAGHETAANWTLNQGRETGHEHIAGVDNRTGEIVHAGTNGLAGEVRFRGDNGAYDHKPDSLTIHHNHPNGTALSSPDLAMLANPAVSHVVSHGHDGTTTIASLTPEMAGHRGSWGVSEQQIGRNGLAIRTASNAALPLAEQILVPLARTGKITPEQANHLYQDVANRLLAAQGAIHYTSTVELPSVVQVALGKTLEGLGHAPENHDRYTGAVQPEDRIASLPAPESGPQGAGGSGSGGEGQGVSQPEQAELGRGEGKLLEGDQRSVQRGLTAEGGGGGGGSRNPPEPPTPPAHGGGDGLESGRRLPLSPIGTSGDVLRDMKGIRRAAAEVKAVLSPTSLRGAKPTEQLIRAHGGTQARSYAQAVHALEQVRNAVDRLPRDEQEEFTYKMETGARQPTPELQVVADTLRHLIDGWANAVRGLGRGYLENARQDYMGHIWGNYHEWSNGLPPPTEKEMEANANAAKQAKTPLRGSGAFLKQRTFDTQREGINAGLVPVTYNPVDLQLIKMREIQKFYHGTKLADQMKTAGIARWVPAGAEGEARDQGLVKLDDRVFQPRIRPESSGTGHNQGPSFGVLEPGNWYAPESAARLFNHYMSRGLSGQSIIYDTFRGANNALNSLQLGLSGFHATFVALDTAISRVALGLQQLSEGKIAKGAGNVLFGWTPATVVRTLNRGRQLGSAFLDPANSTPEIQQIANDMATAGGRMNMDQFYQTTGAGTFFRRLGDLKHPLSPFHQAAQMFRDEPSAIKKAALVPLRIAGRVIDTINHPLMGVMVPAAKRGVFADMAQNWNESHPNATAEERSAAMIKMWDSVDNRMGQLVYDNVFWHKAQKDVAFVLTRSVGWNLGTLREIGGTGPDGVKFLNDAAHGRRPEFTTRMAYTMAMPIVTAIYGAILTYLATGHGPRSLMDYFFPPSGNQDAKGEPQRRVIPGYIKDVIEYSKAPVQTLLNKTSPLVETMAEVHNNRDYYGGTIYDSNRDSMFPAYGDYLLNQALPFSWRGWNKLEQQKAPPLDQALAFWGIQPAPAAITSPERGAAYQARSNYLGDIKRAREPNRLHILTPWPRAVAPPP